MRRMSLFCLLCLFGLIFNGCAGGGIGGTRIGKRDGCYGTLGNKLHFVILTNGWIGDSGVIYDIPFGTRFTGSVHPVSAGEGFTTFCAGARAMQIGDKHFSLEEGRVFLVSTGNQAPGIRQINISLPNKGYEAKALEDPDIRAFCLN